MYIKNIGFEIPKSVEPFSERAKRLNLTKDMETFYERFYGFTDLPYDPDATVDTLLTQAVNNCLAKTPSLDLNTVKWLIFSQSICPNLPFGYNILGKIKEDFALTKANYFGTYGHRCASIIKACQLAEVLFSKQEEQDHILITAADVGIGNDPFVPRMNMVTSSACALLLAKSHDANEVLHITVEQHTEYINHFYTTDRVVNYEKNYVTMLIGLIRRICQDSGIDLNQVKFIFPLHIKKYVWKSAAEQLNFPFEKIYFDNASRIAHCFTSDAWINFALASETNLLDKGDLCILVTVGLAGSFTAVLIRV